MLKFGRFLIIILKEQRNSLYLLQFRQLLYILERYKLVYLYIYLSLFQSFIKYYKRLNMLLFQSNINLNLLEREKTGNVFDILDDESNIE